MNKKTVLGMLLLLFVLLTACTPNQERAFREQYEDEIREEVAEIARDEINKSQQIEEKPIPELNIPKINKSVSEVQEEFQILEEEKDALNKEINMRDPRATNGYNPIDYDENPEEYERVESEVRAWAREQQQILREKELKIHADNKLAAAWDKWNSYVEAYEAGEISYLSLELAKIDIESKVEPNLD